MPSPTEPPRPAPTRSRARRAAGRVALLTASTLLSLLAAEGAFRVYTARDDDGGGASFEAWRRRVSRMNATIYRRSGDPRLVYEPVPSSRVEMDYGTAGFNAGAMRDDRERAVAPPGGRVRVAVVGDSVVWGEGVGVRDALPRALESALGSDRYEVLNFGVTGYDTAQEAAWFERAVAPYRPAVVAVVFCMNDLMIMSGPYNRYATEAEEARKRAQEAFFDRAAPVRAETVASIAARELDGSALRLLARGRVLRRTWRYERSERYTDEYILSFARPGAYERLRASLAALGGAIRAAGARPYLVISPVLRAFQNYHWRGLHAQVTRAAQEAGFTVHDPLDAWARTERAEDLRLPGDSLHYSAAGNRVFAASIARTLPGALPGTVLTF